MRAISICLFASALALAGPATAGWWPDASAAAPAPAPNATAGAVATPAPARPPRTGRIKAVASTAVPEPADFALFAAGVIGLLLGRRGSRSRRD